MRRIVRYMRGRRSRGTRGKDFFLGRGGGKELEISLNPMPIFSRTSSVLVLVSSREQRPV